MTFPTNSKRIRPLRVKSLWRWKPPKLQEDPVFYCNVLIALVFFGAVIPAIGHLLFIDTQGLAKKLLFDVFVAVLSVAIGLRVDSWEWLRLVLGRMQSRGITKDAFEEAVMPKKWDDYFVMQIKLAGLAPLSYPNESGDPETLQLPAYSVWSFVEGHRTIRFERRAPNESSHFINRVSGSEGEFDPAAQFSPKEITDFGKKRGQDIWEAPAVWVTGIAKEDDAVTLYYNPTTYFKRYALCNEAWFQRRRFKKMEGEFPCLLLQKHFPNIVRGDYRVLEDNPSVPGVEVLLLARGNGGEGRTLVFQLRSGRTAVNRGTIVPSVSAGYEPGDINDSSPTEGERAVFAGAVREAASELALDLSQIERYALLGLLHIVPSNELNFVVLVETSLTLDGLISQLREHIEQFERNKGTEREGNKAAEHWEYNKVVAVSASEVVNFDGEWKRYFRRNRDKLERSAYALHYYRLTAAAADKVPWRNAPFPSLLRRQASKTLQ